MRVITKYLLGWAVIFGVAPAHSADMLVKAPPRPIAAPWTGFYFGANAGPEWTRKRWYDIYGPVPDYALDADAKLFTGLGGFQLGYNWQLDRTVLGFQGDFDWSGTGRSFSCFSFGAQTCSANAEWIATLTGRAGYLFGSALFFVDAGPAWVRDTVSDIASTGAVVPVGGGGVVGSSPGDLFLGSQTRLGWTIGAGLEYRLSPNWSVFAQYSYMNFGDRAITLTDGGTGIFPEEIKQEMQLVKIGVNYRLTGPFGAGATLAAVPDLLTGQDDDTDKKIRVFSILDVGKDSVDGAVGGLFAFSKDLDTSGPRVWMTGGAGWYQFPDSSGGKIRGVYSTGDLLAGYGFEGDNYEVNLLIGGSAENDMLSSYDSEDPVQGTAFGVKVRGDTYYNPTPKTVISAEGEYSTAFQTYYTSATYGYDFFDKNFFVGPEVSFFGDQRFDQWRVGARVTAITIGRLKFDVSSGFAHDSVVGDGAYGHIEMATSF